jgi:hypothetical protein
MKSVPNWIYDSHEFFSDFLNCLSIFLGLKLEFGSVLFQKFLSCGARRSAALSPSSRSYWPSGVAQPDAAGAGINPFRPAPVLTAPSPCPKPRRHRSRVRSRPSPHLEHRVTARGPKQCATAAIPAGKRRPHATSARLSRCQLTIASSFLSGHRRSSRRS